MRAGFSLRHILGMVESSCTFIRVLCQIHYLTDKIADSICTANGIFDRIFFDEMFDEKYPIRANICPSSAYNIRTLQLMHIFILKTHTSVQYSLVGLCAQ